MPGSEALASSNNLKGQVVQDIRQHKVLVYSKSYCPFAKATKDLLQSKGITAKIYELDQMDNGDAIQEILATISGQNTVPNVYINGKHIGGNSEVQDLNEAGKLEETINSA